MSRIAPECSPVTGPLEGGSEAAVRPKQKDEEGRFWNPQPIPNRPQGGRGFQAYFENVLFT